MSCSSPPKTSATSEYITAGIRLNKNAAFGFRAAVFGQRVYRMMDMVKEILYETDDEKFLKTYNRIEKYEQISDRMEVEIADYLTRVLEGRLSA